MKYIKLKMRILIIFCVILSIIATTYFMLKPKDEFIVNAATDGIGNVYTISYDENNVYIKKINKENVIEWMDSISISEEKLIIDKETLSITPKGRLLVYLYQYNSDTYKKDNEKIYLYSNDGKQKTLVFEDKKDLGVESTISNIQCYNNNLYFFQMDLDGEKFVYNLKSIELSEISNNNVPEPQIITTIKDETVEGINNIIYAGAGNTVYTTHSSEIYKVSQDNKKLKLYPEKDNLDKKISGLSYDLNGNIYFQDINTNGIMSINLENNMLQKVYEDDELKAAGIDYKKLKEIKFESRNKFLATRTWNKSSNNIVCIYENGSVKNLENLKYSFSVIFNKLLYSIFMHLSILGSLILILFILIKLNKDKITINLKQGIVFTTIIIISIIIILITATTKLSNIVNKELIEQIYSISKNKLDIVTAKRIKEINWNYPYGNETYEEIYKNVTSLINDDKIYNSIDNSYMNDPHNAIYTVLYTVKDNKILTGIFDENFLSVPIDYIYSDEDIGKYEKALKEKDYVYTELMDENGEWLALISPIVDEDGKVVALLEVGITKKGFVSNTISNNAKQIAITNTIIGLTMIVIMISVLYYLLMPLKRLKNGVDELLKGNLGVQIQINSNDEVAEISRVFNKMSENLKNDMDKLTNLNEAYYRFVPLKMFELLNRKNILDVRMGDQVKTNISLLSMTTNNFKELSATMDTEEIFTFINKIFSDFVPIIGSNGGVIERYNNSGFISLFPRNFNDAVIDSAIKICEKIKTSNNSILNKVDIGFVINKEDIMLGIVGCEERFGASIVSEYLSIIDSLSIFGNRYGSSILVTENSVDEINNTSFNYRELGYIKYKGKDQIVKLYDFFDGDEYETIVLKKQTKSMFEKAVHLYWKRDFYNARKMFIEVLKNFQDDKASKEYLKLCDQYYKLENGEDVPIYLEIF